MPEANYQSYSSFENNLTPELLEGATLCEKFCLFPSQFDGREANVRLVIKSRFGGWKLKDDLVKSMDMEVGNTIALEVSVMGGPGIASDFEDLDLFACGSTAMSLFDAVQETKRGPIGCIFDCKVRFHFGKAPVGGPLGNEVYKASLCLLKSDYVGFLSDRGEREDPFETLASKLRAVE